MGFRLPENYASLGWSRPGYNPRPVRPPERPTRPPNVRELYPGYDPDPRWLYGWEPPASTGDINADYASLTDDQRDAYGDWRESDAYKPGWDEFVRYLRGQHMREQGWKPSPHDIVLRRHEFYGGYKHHGPQIRAMGVPSNRTPGTPYNPGQVPRVQANRPSQMHQYRQQWKSPAPYNPTQAKRPSSNWY